MNLNFSTVQLVFDKKPFLELVFGIVNKGSCMQISKITVRASEMYVLALYCKT